MDLSQLEAVLRSRLVDPPPDSYSATLVSDPERAARKVMEESFELCVELGRQPVDRDRVVSEAADALFHILAALVGAGVSVGEVLGELERRAR
ncbi:MAG TPA: phosphoribosyl-ATP diphosphatase [Egibacteraceae bacterium]|nr:phosphoribosyl-ATP diphosphatase [Egibacteraceae bacterium]